MGKVTSYGTGLNCLVKTILKVRSDGAVNVSDTYDNAFTYNWLPKQKEKGEGKKATKQQ